MKKDTFAFGTDFHGNLDNVDTFLKEAASRETEYVFFGGDIAPKKITLAGSDGRCFEMEKMYDQIIYIPQGNDEEAYRKGYIALHEDLGSDEIELMVKLLAKIQESIKSSGTDKIPQGEIWEKTDFHNMEKYLKEEFLDFLKTNEAAGRLFKSMEKNLRSHYRMSVTPEEIWQQFINSQKIKFITGQKMDLFGKEGANFFGFKRWKNKQHLHQVADPTIITTSEFQSIMRSFCLHSPRILKWTNIHQNAPDHSLEGQQKSISDLIRRVSEFQQTTRAKVICILGNDDHPELEAQFLEAEQSGILHYAGNRIVQVDPELQVLGYNHVLPLRFSFDAWYKTETEIARDLEELRMQLRENVARTVFNIHMPPAGIGLAMAKIDNPYVEDYGSEAIASFIKDTAPSHVFSGHMHKSWYITGKIREQLGSSLVHNPGDSEDTPRLIFGNFNNPENTGLVRE